MSKNKLLFLGFTITTSEVIKEIEEHNKQTGLNWNIIVVSKKEFPRLENTKHIKKDFTEPEILEDKEIALEECKCAIIFSERQPDESPNATDIRTILTVYNIKKKQPSLYTLAEIVNKENSQIIKNTKCDAIIFKDDIDAQLLINCIKLPKISHMLYELLSIEGKVIEETTLEKIGFTKETTFKEVKLYGMKHNMTFISYITAENQQTLAPRNKETIRMDYRLFYIK